MCWEGRLHGGPIIFSATQCTWLYEMICLKFWREFDGTLACAAHSNKDD